MSLRYIAALAAFGLVAIATAGDKKKLDYAPETGPKPRQVPECSGLTLPSTHYSLPPQYFPAEPQFPIPSELSYQVPVKSRPAGRPVIKTYSVADLVVPIPPAGKAPEGKPETQERPLIRKVCTAVTPECWQALGGECSIEFFPVGMALVVNAPPSVQEEVEKYLDGLRQIQDTQFQIKVVVATVSDAVLEKLGLARDFGPTGKAGEVRTRVKFLSADDVRALDLHKGDCLDLTAPTLAVLNGQKGCAHVGEVEHFLTGVTVQVIDGKLVYTPKNEPHELGVTVEVQPWLTADRKFVKLGVSAKARQLTVRPVGTIPLTIPGKVAEVEGRQGDLGSFSQVLQDPRIACRSVDETVTLPDGGTVVCYGGPATTEAVVREKAPGFADVPFLQEIMVRDKKVTGTNHLLVFATPQVVKGPGCDECVQCAGTDGTLAVRLAQYHKACRDGLTDEARRLAMECLVINPTCFSKK